MKAILFATAGVLALSLGACGPSNKTEGAATPSEQAATPDANPAMTVPTPANEAVATDFVPKAAASDMFEIAAAKLAQTKSTNADVKAFAKMMVTAHTKSSAEIKKAAASAPGVVLPTALPDDLKGKLDDLQKADAKDFDKKYIDGQVDSHQAALDLMQRYAQDGDVADLKTAAASIAPIVQTHLDAAKKIQDALK